MRPDGLGYMVDFGSLDQLIGVPNQHAYADVFSCWPGAISHVAIGAFAALMPSRWSVLAASSFTAYEASKLAAGKSRAAFAGSLIEFSIGVLLGILCGGPRA